LPADVAAALASGCYVELRPSGDFFIHPPTMTGSSSTDSDEDVEMTDAPLLTPPDSPSETNDTALYDEACHAQHSRTDGECPSSWPELDARIPHLRNRLRLDRDTRHTPIRLRAFQAIKDLTRSRFGNGASPLVHEVRLDEDSTGAWENSNDGRRVDSWKLAPIWETVRKNGKEGLCYRKDAVSGTPISEYVMP
jgi:hypothetical protein